MQRGVAAEAVRVGIVDLDGVTGKVLGEPKIEDLSEDPFLRCKK